jgi:uncharacterized repeat protein (TIGR01451 family)
MRFGSTGLSLRARATAIGVALVALTLLGFTVLTAWAGINGDADLAVEKTDSPDPVDTGELLTYTISVENLPGNDAFSVAVVDKLSNKLDFVSATPSQGTCDRNGRTVTCALGELSAGGNATIETAVRPQKTGTISNTATVASDNPDPNAANNSDTETTEVNEGPKCGGNLATIAGTDGSDVLTGTEGRDVVSTLGGKDEVNSLGGKDAICGKGGNDKLKGESGSDLVKGGGGKDKPKGSGGNDEVRGGAKSDHLRGGGGNDLLDGGKGNDTCEGGGGSDVLTSC